jgi:PAS domain S-box-containing protein
MSFAQRLDQRLQALWPTASLRAYLIAVMLLAIAPIAVIMSMQVFNDVRSDQAQLEDELARSAGALSQAVERQLVSSIDGLLVLAQSELFQQGRIAAMGRLLQGRPRRDWDSVFLLDRDGSLVLDTAAPEVRVDPPLMRELQTSVMRRRGPVVMGPAEGQRPGARFVSVALPIVQKGAMPYVLGVRMGESVWQRLAAGASKPAGANAALFDAKDQLIGYSMADVAPAGAALPRDAALSMHASPAGVHRSSDVDGHQVYAAWQSVPMADWRVRVAVPAAPIDAAHRQAMLAALTTSGGSLLVGLLLAALVARRVARPLRRLAMQGPAGLAGPVPVREATLLRDALVRARAEDSEAHSELRIRAQEFESLFNNSPVGMAFAHDVACRVITHNAAMDVLLGPLGSQEAGAVRVLHQGHLLAPGQQPLQRAATLGETVRGMELEIAIEGQPSVFVIANAVPLHDPHGRPRGAISTLVDITQRKRAEQQLVAAERQLRESQRLMDLAQEAGHVGFFHYQFTTDRLTWTPGQCRLFGIDDLPAAGLAGWLHRIAPEDRDRLEREFWTACALRRETETFDYRVVLPDETRCCLSSRIQFHYNREGRAVQLIGVTVDLTEQMETERQRALLTEQAVAAREQAEAVSRAKDEFLTMLSHELRNPLGAISAAVDVLEAAAAGSPTAEEARCIIGRQTRNLAHMMNDLLDVSRVLAGKILLARQPVNLAAAVRRVDQTLALTGQTREHPLRLDLQDAWVDGDAVRLEQVVTNLLTNAIRYTAAGRPVQVQVGVDGNWAVLQVQDAGTGIPAALLPHLFELFVQGDRPLDRSAGGLGVGLTLVRRLVELHGGTVTVDSSSEGSRFTVRLPLTAAPALDEGDTLRPSRRRNVLVVEDNGDVLAALRAKLELDGHQVSTAVDGLEGLSRLLKLKPEVSIVDIGLPGLNGLELARHARAAGYAGRMIALSGYGAERDAQEALVAGFDAYLVKPVDREQLRASLSAD